MNERKYVVVTDLGIVGKMGRQSPGLGELSGNPQAEKNG